jgi:hypothetical protein
VKGKGHPRTGHEDPKGEQIYSSILSLTSVLDEGGCSTPRPVRFTPRERPGTHCIGGLVGPRAGLDGCGKSRPYLNSIPGPSAKVDIHCVCELESATKWFVEFSSDSV